MTQACTQFLCKRNSNEIPSAEIGLSRTEVSPVVEGTPQNPKNPKGWTTPSWRSIVAQRRGSSADKWWVLCSAGPGNGDSHNNIVIIDNNNNNGTIHHAASTAQAKSGNAAEEGSHWKATTGEGSNIAAAADCAREGSKARGSNTAAAADGARTNVATTTEPKPSTTASANA